MRRISAAVLVGLAIVLAVTSPLHGADFAPIFPKPGSPLVDPPNLTWAAGDYDLFLLFLYIPSSDGYRFIPVWRHKKPYLLIPDRLWERISPDRWCFWLVVGLKTTFWNSAATRWQYFKKVSDCIVVFPDPNLEQAIREEIDKPAGAIMASELRGLDTLWLSARDISDIRGLEYLTDLNQLWLDNNRISDISPLAGLTRLYEVFIWSNQIDDISPLAGLTQLDYLLLGDNPISDIRPLNGLENLSGLYLWYNQISDIRPLRNLTNLYELVLSGNQIRDIRPLAALTNLEWLWLPANRISNIRPLADLVNLKDLWLGDNQISDINPLADLTNLVYLWLEHNQIRDIFSLVQNSGITSGDEVNLASNPLSPTSCTDYIPQLESRGVGLIHDCP